MEEETKVMSADSGMGLGFLGKMCLLVVVAGGVAAFLKTRRSRGYSLLSSSV